MNGTRRGTPDFLLLFLTFSLVGFGLVMVFSASSMISVASEFTNYNAWYFTKKQIIWASLGTMAMFVLMNIPVQRLRKWFHLFFAVTVVLLILVLLIGKEVKGARSWFGFGTLGIQPTEFAKLAVVLYLSSLINKKGETIRDFQTGLLPVFIIVGLVAGLIMLQPDLGSMLILLSCALIVIIAGGANLIHLIKTGALLTGALGLFLGVYLLVANNYGYRIERITSFFNPWNDPQDASYQLVQSLYAFGHGGITGTGIGRSIQKLYYLPEAHNDFIFAIIGEELGFIGSALFLLVYLAFIWRGLIVTLRSGELFNMLIGIGIVGMIGIQAIVNIGGVTGSIPITGVTLPLISYGGSSLLVTMASVGILLSISRDAHRTEKQRRPE